MADAARARTPIDAFILATLKDKKLEPSPPADRRTLIRRITVDLTGLPPTPEEVRAFLADVSSDSYEKLVDRLLASPAYGERWARHWLDVVHYGESHRFGMDRPRNNAWPYRDYVIRSLNDDKPYARFVQEQLAGDVLFPDDPQATIALGFIACGPWNQSALAEQTDNTACKRSAQNLDRDDMVTTTMSTFVSTTVHCARCHDHKLDPVSQREYYDLQSVFAAVDKADRPYDADPQVHALRRKLNRQKQAMESPSAPAGVELPPLPSEGEVAAWEQSLAEDEARWQVLVPAAAYADAGGDATPQADGSVLFTRSPPPETDTYTIIAHTRLRGITAVRLETLTDPSLPQGGPGRADNGNFALNELRLAIGSATDETPPVDQPFARATADADHATYPIGATIDQNEATGWSIHPEVGRSHVAVFTPAQPIAGHEGGTTLRFQLVQKTPKGYLLGRPRLAVTSDPRSGLKRPLPAAIAAVLKNPLAARTDSQKAEIATYLRSQHVNEQLAALPAQSYVYAGTNEYTTYGNFKPAKVPRPVSVLRRGEIDQALAAATPGALACVLGLPPGFTLPDPNDEGNQYLWRMNRSRLDAECVRDAILQMTDRLDRTMGGPSVKQSVFLDADVGITPKADYGSFDVDSPASRRRSVYRFLLRTVPDPFMESMDCPDASQLTAKRNVSVTPLQALAMMNNRFVVRYAEHLAERVTAATPDAPERIARAYELALNRRPTSEESAALVEYAGTYGMANACRVILNGNEFLFVD